VKILNREVNRTDNCGNQLVFRGSAERILEINHTLLNLGHDFSVNCNELTALCGTIFGATCALYNRIQDGMLFSTGEWNTPPDYDPIDNPEGHICYDVIRGDSRDVMVVRNLPDTVYAVTDPNVSRYSLRTYMGCPVFSGSGNAGSICVVFQDDYEPSEEDKHVLGIIASALASEEDRLKAAEELNKRLSYEKLLSRLSAMAVHVKDMGKFFDEILEDMGKTLQVCRSYLFRHNYNNNTMTNIAEWCAPGVTPQIGNLQSLPVEIAPWWAETLRNGENICFPKSENILDEEFRKFIIAQDILSILSVPLFVEGEYFGFIGFDVCRDYRTWPEEDIDLIFSLSRIISSVIERRRSEELRERLQEQLLQAQKMESVGRLAGGVAHDFNNMLSVIFGNTEVAMLQLGKEHPVAADLQEILDAAERSSDLVKQLLAFARKQVITPGVLNLNKVIGDIFKILEKLAGEKIRLVQAAGENLWPVRMDESQLGQILVNLVINARDSIEKSGTIIIESAGVSIDIDYCRKNPVFNPGDYVVLFVRDTGCGMDKEIVSKIFEPFYTTKAPGKGSGLGLSTVYGIVKQNGGFIKVDSEPGVGTVFEIYLPRYCQYSEV
jgi:signal transduction histidine kinase